MFETTNQLVMALLLRCFFVLLPDKVVLVVLPKWLGCWFLKPVNYMDRVYPLWILQGGAPQVMFVGL